MQEDNQKKLQQHVVIYNFFLKNDINFDLAYSGLFRKIIDSLPNKDHFESVVLQSSLMIEQARRTAIKKLPIAYITFLETNSQMIGVVTLVG